MKRALMFTAHELIICVTPGATGSELALSGKKTEDHSTLDTTVFRQVLQCEIFFSKWAQKPLGTSARQYYSSK